MISAGIVNALIAWASGNDARIAQLVAERDALVTAFLSGGDPAGTLSSASANGKSFTFLASLSQEDKLAVLTAVLTHLGRIDPAITIPSVTYGNFSGIQR